jgi:hypothetical protein
MGIIGTTLIYIHTPIVLRHSHLYISIPIFILIEIVYPIMMQPLTNICSNQKGIIGTTLIYIHTPIVLRHSHLYISIPIFILIEIVYPIMMQPLTNICSNQKVHFTSFKSSIEFSRYLSMHRRSRSQKSVVPDVCVQFPIAILQEQYHLHQ